MVSGPAPENVAQQAEFFSALELVSGLLGGSFIVTVVEAPDVNIEPAGPAARPVAAGVQAPPAAAGPAVFGAGEIEIPDAPTVEAAEAPVVEAVSAPVETVAAPVETVAAPVETVSAPVETVAAPTVDTTANVSVVVEDSGGLGEADITVGSAPTEDSFAAPPAVIEDLIVAPPPDATIVAP